MGRGDAIIEFVDTQIHSRWNFHECPIYCDSLLQTVSHMAEISWLSGSALLACACFKQPDTQSVGSQPIPGLLQPFSPVDCERNGLPGPLCEAQMFASVTLLLPCDIEHMFQ